jgi:peptide deformylase
MIRPILHYGAPGLRQPARPVTAITPDVSSLITDMIDTMHAAPGIGLAAPQVGEALRVVVLDLSVGARPDDLLVLINPEWVSREGMQLEEESCLSLPGLSATVARPARVVVSGQDRHGQPIEVAGDGLLARALQHEIDHLDGLLFIDRLRGIQRRLLLREWTRRQRRERS